VIPEIIASLTFKPLVKQVFNNNPLYVVMLGGASLLLAALLVARVKDVAGNALASNQDAVIGQQIAEQLPAIVGEAAKAFGNIDHLTVLNGAEGMGQMFSQVLGMGAAAIPMLRDAIERTSGSNGGGRGTNGAPTTDKKPTAGTKGS